MWARHLVSTPAVLSVNERKIASGIVLPLAAGGYGASRHALLREPAVKGMLLTYESVVSAIAPPPTAGCCWLRGVLAGLGTQDCCLKQPGFVVTRPPRVSNHASHACEHVALSGIGPPPAAGDCTACRLALLCGQSSESCRSFGIACDHVCRRSAILRCVTSLAL